MASASELFHVDERMIQSDCKINAKNEDMPVFSLMIDKLKASFEICHFFITPYAVYKSFCGVKILTLIKF